MAHHNYCSNCGAPLDAADQFCPNCGVKISQTEYGSPGNGERTDAPNTTGAFPRMLAYIPGLFWAPLAADSKDKDNRECANQGLLLLLYSIIVPVLFSVIGAILAYVGITSATSTMMNQGIPYQYSTPNTYPGFDSFGAYFNHFGALFQPLGHAAVSNSIAGSLLSLLCVPIFLYVPVNSMWGFIHCISHREAHILPLIGKIKIIK